MASSYGTLFPFDKEAEMDGMQRETTGFDTMIPDDEDTIMEKAVRKLVNRQKAVIQEQRLHTLFQILGLTLHELNQPLTSLLGNIELVGLYRGKPEKSAEFLERIDEAGKRLSNAVKKIQEIRAEMRMPHYNLMRKQVSGRPFHILAMVRSDDVFHKITESLAETPGITTHRAFRTDRVFPVLNNSAIDLMFVDDPFLGHSGPRFIKDIKDRYNDLPLVVIADAPRGPGFWFALLDIAEEYLVKQQVDRQALLRVIDSAMETALLKKRHAFSLEKIAEISQQDPVTGLFQRRFFVDAVEREIIKAGRSETAFVIYKIGIDDMKSIIEAGGEEAATCILSDISAALRRFVGKNDTLCRYDNHSFAFIQPVETESDSDVIREKLEKLFRRYFNGLDSFMPSTGVSIRTVFYTPQNPCTGNDLIKKMV